MTQETKEEKPQEDWMTKKWRPMMAMMYMTCCLCDFAIFPIMFTVVQFWETSLANDAFRQWQPITLQGGGLFHMAMGAVLGVSAWSRGQEKMAGVAAGNQQPAQTSAALAPQQNPAPQQQQTNFPQTGFNGTSAQDLAPPPAQVKTGYGGKPAPQQEFPLI